MSEPWMKFYPRDWRGDQSLRAVSVAARGLWIECLCIMHEAKPYGHLVLNGKPVEGDVLARMTGVPVDEVSALMAELRQAGVLSVTSRGVVFSRRMTKDHARAQKGRKAANKRWSQVSDDVEQSDAPNGSPIGPPITQKPEARSQKEIIEPLIAQHPTAARKAALPKNWLDLALEANGMSSGFREERNVGLLSPAPFLGLIDGGFDFFADILPGISAKPNPMARTWAYFDGQIRDFATIRTKAASTPRPPQAQNFDWRKALEVYRDGTWAAGWGPKPGERGCRVPPPLLAEFGFERAA